MITSAPNSYDSDTKAKPLDLRIVFFVVALCMALIEFGKVWYFDADDRGLITSRPFGGPYRALLWLTCLAGLILHFARHGLTPLLLIIAPLFAFVGWGAVGVFVFSIDKVISIRSLIFWGLAVGISAAAGYELGARTLARSVYALFVGVIVASVILYLINPEAATAYWKETLVFRGLFPQKNLLGWFMAIGLIFLVAQTRHFSSLETFIGGSLLLVGLILSGSASAQVIALFIVIFMFWLRFVIAVFNDGSRAFLATILALITATGGIILLLPLILEALGRDMTLTGRTDVWGHYLSYILDDFISGYGPGLLSGTSPVAIAIGGSIPGHEEMGLFSTHSVFITILGEVGVVGLGIYVAGLFYVALIAPFRSNDPWSLLAAGLAMAILIAGVTESRDGYLPGIATILMFAARAQVIRAKRSENPALRKTLPDHSLATNMPATFPP